MGIIWYQRGKLFFQELIYRIWGDNTVSMVLTLHMISLDSIPNIFETTRSDSFAVRSNHWALLDVAQRQRPPPPQKTLENKSSGTLNLELKEWNLLNI